MDFLLIHNLLWTPYKGDMYSETYKKSQALGLDFGFIHIAETSKARRLLSPVDLSFHRYPYSLLFSNEDIESISQLRLSYRLIRKVHELNPKVVLVPGYDSIAFWILLLYATFRRMKVVSSLDSTEADRRRAWAKELPKKFFYRFVDSVVCYGQRSKEYLLKLGVSSEKIFPGCQSVPIRQTPTEMLWRNQSSFELLYVGRLSAEKNIKTLLNAFSIAACKNEKLNLRLIGGGSELTSLKEHANKLNIQSRITWTPSMPTQYLEKYYDEAYALILPSVSEPWGLVVNEALQSGCPAIVTPQCGCVPELVTEGETGWIAESSDSTGISNAIALAIESADKRQDIGASCIKRIKMYTPAAAADKLIAAYHFARNRR